MDPLGRRGVSIADFPYYAVAQSPTTLPASNWSFKSANSSAVANNVNPIVTGTVTPNTGDLLFLSWSTARSGAGVTSAAPTDTGSGGWTAVGAINSLGGTFTRVQAWWKVATSSDFNSGSGITITVTATGGSGSITNTFVEADVFRLASGTTPAIDLATSFGQQGATVTTVSRNPASGSSNSSFTDELAITALYTTGSNGGITGTNTFTGTSSAKNLAICLTANDAQLCNQFVGGVQASATAGSNTWVNTWTTAQFEAIFAATFSYTP